MPSDIITNAMQKRINFEDNIFSLNIRLRMIRDILLLDTDPDLFLGKILDDIEFIDGTLGALLNSLRENRHLIDREEQFQNLAETEGRFLDVLAALTKNDGNISAIAFPMIQEKIEPARNHIQERRNILDESIPKTNGAPPEPLVSPDELNELLRDLK